MSTHEFPGSSSKWPTLAGLPLPAKALVSAVILTIAVGMIGALGQIIVHDIIPTFFSVQPSAHRANYNTLSQDTSKDSERTFAGRGDLFSEEPVAAETTKKLAF